MRGIEAILEIEESDQESCDFQFIPTNFVLTFNCKHFSKAIFIKTVLCLNKFQRNLRYKQKLIIICCEKMKSLNETHKKRHTCHPTSAADYCIYLNSDVLLQSFELITHHDRKNRLAKTIFSY